jgi:hypothetical protein
MIKSLIFTMLTILLASSIYAQEIVTTRPQLKGVVLEEYTGINCPYCPQGHAAAEAILTANPDKVSIIAIHQGYFANPDEGQPDFTTSFGNALAGQTSLEGYPSGTVNRHYFSDLSTSGGTALNRSDWEEASDEILLAESYLNIGVETDFDDLTRLLTVNVEVYYTANLPFGINSNFIQIAIVESGIIAYQSGGSANYNHKHMLRHLITDQWGDEIVAPDYGTLISRTYTYTMPEGWVAENCEIVAFVTETRQEIITGKTVELINGFSNGEVTADYGRLFADDAVIVGEESVQSDFGFTIINGFNDLQDMTLSLSYDAPADWIVNFEYNSVIYTETANITLNPDEIATAQIHIIPGATAGVAKCILSLGSTDLPALAEKVCEVFLVSGVDNLIVNGSGTNSDISSYEFEHFYKDGLNFAGCETVGAIPGYAFEQAVDLGALENVRNLYLNIGGTTPVLTMGQVLILRDYLDDGGNLFIAGQDFARDIMGSGGTSGSITHKTFFQNYLSAIYLNDGDSENNSIATVNADSVFGFIPNSALIDAYDGTFDPDAIKKSTNSFDIFLYPNGKSGGLRAYRGSSRIVLLAFGLEQIANEDTRNDIMDRTYRWFEGWEGTSLESNIFQSVKICPNPANDFIVISGVDDVYSAEVFDVTGKLFITSNISTIDISSLKDGIYFVRISDINGITNHKIVKQ